MGDRLLVAASPDGRSAPAQELFNSAFSLLGLLTGQILGKQPRRIGPQAPRRLSDWR